MSYVECDGFVDKCPFFIDVVDLFVHQPHHPGLVVRDILGAVWPIIHDTHRSRLLIVFSISSTARLSSVHSRRAVSRRRPNQYFDFTGCRLRFRRECASSIQAGGIVESNLLATAPPF
jgi:hypothetical protein